MIKQSLLPDDAHENPDITSFAALENGIVRHVSSLDPTPTNVAWNDSERISDPDLYWAVADDFFHAMPGAPEDVPVDCSYDESTEVVTVTIDFNGKKSSASFVQVLDWVTSEFFDLMLEVTASKSGRFVELSPGDQSFMFVYLKPSVANALDDYRARDADSRESVFTSQSESAKHRFKDLKILSRREFQSALARLKHKLMNGDDPADPTSYRDGAAIRVATASKYDRALQLHTRARRGGTDQYAMLERWHHEAICPDEDCYVLMMQQPEREIVFERKARSAGMTMGDQEKDFGSFMLVARDGNWGIFADDDFLTCSGEKVLSLLEPLLQPLPENKNGDLFVRLRADVDALLESFGYARPVPKHGTYYAREYANHLALIDVAGRQEAPDDPVDVSLSLRQYCASIDGLLYKYSGTLDTSVWRAERKPPGGETTKWTIDGEPDLESVREEVEALIRDAVTWLDKPESREDWQRFLEDEGDYLAAAAAAVARDDRDNAQRLADLTLAEADNKDSYTAGEDVRKLKAMGLKVKKA